MRTQALIDSVLAGPEVTECPPVLVDVGASGGIHAPWKAIAQHCICIGFDPDDRDFSTAPGSRGFRECHVEKAIVTDRDADAYQVHLTRSPYCSSTLRPNTDGLAGYAHSPLFEIVGTSSVPSMRLTTVLDRHKLDRVDWLKTDSQGIDRRVFESLSPELQRRAMIVELEPGIMEGYAGEDHVSDVMEAFRRHPFWCASLIAKGAVRGHFDVLSKYLGHSVVPSLPATERTGAGWVEVEYFNTFDNTEMQTKRNLLLGWTFAILRGHRCFALELAHRGLESYPEDDRFEHLASHAARDIIKRHRLGLIGRGMRKLRRLMGPGA